MSDVPGFRNAVEVGQKLGPSVEWKSPNHTQHSGSVGATESEELLSGRAFSWLLLYVSTLGSESHRNVFSSSSGSGGRNLELRCQQRTHFKDERAEGFTYLLASGGSLYTRAHDCITSMLIFSLNGLLHCLFFCPHKGSCHWL